MDDTRTLEYERVQMRTSPLALVALVVGGLSLPLFFLGLPAVIGLVLAFQGNDRS